MNPFRRIQRGLVIPLYRTKVPIFRASTARRTQVNLRGRERGQELLVCTLIRPGGGRTMVSFLCPSPFLFASPIVSFSLFSFGGEHHHRSGCCYSALQHCCESCAIVPRWDERSDVVFSSWHGSLSLNLCSASRRACIERTSCFCVKSRLVPQGRKREILHPESAKLVLPCTQDTTAQTTNRPAHMQQAKAWKWGGVRCS